MIKLQQWSPDTCGCTVEVSWDTDNPDAPHQFVRTVRVCAVHAAHEGSGTHLAEVLDENVGKNHAVNEFAKRLTDVVGKDVKPDDVPWAFNGTRTLELNIPAAVSKDVSAAAKDLIQGHLDAVLSKGVVVK